MELLNSSSDEELLEILKTSLKERVGVLQELVEWAAPDIVYASSRVITDVRYSGHVKSSTERYGFVTSEDITKAFGKDVYVHDRQMRGFRAGDPVNFAILLKEGGKPEAFDLMPDDGAARAAGGYKGGAVNGKGTAMASKAAGPEATEIVSSKPGKGAPSGSAVQMEGVTDRRFYGVVKSAGKEFGFIICEELAGEFGKDIYAHHKQLEGIAIGEAVDFAVIVNEKLKPQAVDVRIAADAGGKTWAADSGGQAWDYPPYAGKGGKWGPCGGDGKGWYGPGADYGWDSMGWDSPAAWQAWPPAGKGWDVPEKGGWPQGKGKAGPPPVTELQMPGVTDRRFFGSVKTIGKTYGFVICAELAERFGKEDIYASTKVLDGYELGAQVDFAVVVNKEGKPMAVDLWPAGPGSGGGAAGYWPPYPAYDAKGGGKGGKGFAAPKGGYGEWSAGAHDGWDAGPKGGGGKGLRSPPPPDAVSAVEVPGVTDRRFEGTVKSCGKEYGFLICEELMERYGKDTFTHIKLLDGFTVGDAVDFRVIVNDQGKPQAIDLHPAGPGRKRSRMLQ